MVIQHLKADHRRYLDGVLRRVTHIPVVRVTKNIPITTSTVYILAENKIMTVKHNCLLVRDRMPREISNFAVDIFFSSLANDFKYRAIGIILSGGGTDGAKGVHLISKNGGMVMVQEPPAALYPYMPNSAIQMGHPTNILTPENLAKALLTHTEKFM